MLPSLDAILWNVNPIIAHLGPVTLRWYGLFFMLPFVVGTFILTHIYRSERVSPQWVDVITIYMLIGTIVGARLGHMLFYDFDELMKDPMVVFKIWQGGLASHGATIGILFACWLFARNNKFDYLWVLDRIVIVVALGGACIRTGNLMNSEIVGKPSSAPWAFTFPRDTEHLLPATQPLPVGAELVDRVAQPNGTYAYPIHAAGQPVTADTLMAVPRHPTQIYEALFCIFLLILLYSMWNRTKEHTPRGQLFGLFVVLLFIQRFLGEYLKENQVAFENGHMFNQGQLLSIPLIFIGIWVLWRAGKDPENPYGYAPRDLGKEGDAQHTTVNL
ncbi:prolipoprotein diacylglyceryl transferase [Hymenobacter negativus]|uniref:Phosphatidylglycerol--prolipoprotein diacylglyceryl transferase n=1 Tax=Hymenobacter negativus TaxID=2795026 RepID=A0ABS0Q5D9_9BACT|nr:MULTISPECIES: prolipoprotein diacylglyceryl transferase [Bacteria]MBH8557568.1 prolipoprotein diacylglyceryl transferase [Hymenobacter negativus]MBH8567900.1 prolipoprotein diacylglyceryl transferase [Hymenobacter negativus]MBR7207636.1 prolipoprotein diacylglyceryl transferase [Microvirga sp. STS02]